MSDEPEIIPAESPVEDTPPEVVYTLWVRKNPSPSTLASRHLVPEGEPGPDGAEQMTEEEFANWLSTQSEPVALSEEIPQEVTNAQFRVALVLSGISLAAIDSALTSMSEPQRSVARSWWDYANNFKRSNSLIAALAPSFGLTPDRVDKLFILAAQQE
jgi:hypothetical protein